MKSKGFTLIELLVVISIIGLLSSVVLASLNAARGRAADSAVKAAMKQLRNQGPLYRDLNANFGINTANCTTPSTFFMDPQVQKIRANIASNIPSTANVACTTDASGFKWALSVTALKSAGTSWCVDNNTGSFRIGASTAGSCL